MVAARARLGGAEGGGGGRPAGEWMWRGEQGPRPSALFVSLLTSAPSAPPFDSCRSRCPARKGRLLAWGRRPAPARGLSPSAGGWLGPPAG